MPRIYYYQMARTVERCTCEITAAEEIALLGMSKSEAREWLYEKARVDSIKTIETTDIEGPHMWEDSSGARWDIENENEGVECDCCGQPASEGRFCEPCLDGMCPCTSDPKQCCDRCGAEIPDGEDMYFRTEFVCQPCYFVLQQSSEPRPRVAQDDYDEIICA